MWLTLETKVDNFTLRGNDQETIETRMGRKGTKSERIARQVTPLLYALPFFPLTTLSFLVDLDETWGQARTDTNAMGRRARLLQQSRRLPPGGAMTGNGRNGGEILRPTVLRRKKAGGGGARANGRGMAARGRKVGGSRTGEWMGREKRQAPDFKCRDLECQGSATPRSSTPRSGPLPRAALGRDAQNEGEKP